jgi:hypothetical protein
MYDQVSDTDQNLRQVSQDWCANALSKDYMTRDASGEVVAVVGYYDPEIQHKHYFGSKDKGAMMGLGTAWYILPQRPDLAIEMYRAAVKEAEWAVTSKPIDVSSPANRGRNMLLGMVLAHELGDTLVETRLGEVLEVLAEPREFGDGGDEFGYFFHTDEQYPRGQLNALLICAQVGAAGDWQRAFNRPDYTQRFAAPSVVGVDYPTVGIQQAYNERGVLHVKTYAATKARKGEPTEFRITQVPAGAEPVVTCDGEAFDKWAWTAVAGEMKILTTVDDHEFQIEHRYSHPHSTAAPFVPSSVSSGTSGSNVKSRL